MDQHAKKPSVISVAQLMLSEEPALLKATTQHLQKN